MSSRTTAPNGYYALPDGRLQEVPYPAELELVGWFTPKSGYGNVAISLAEALVHHFPSARARFVDPPLSLDILLMMSRPNTAATDSVWISTPNDLMWCHPDVSQHVITMWETDNVPSDYADRFERVANIFVPCPDNVEAFQNFAPHAKVSLLTLGIDSDFWGPPVERDWAGPLRFGMVGTMGMRKYALESARAFKDAFGDRDDVHMEFLTGNPQGFPPYFFESLEVPNQTLTVTKGLSGADLREWYQSKHVLLFPSRGEGYGLPPLEMACTGGAVVATAGMGMYWFNANYGFPIPWKWVPTKGFPWSRGAHWMEPEYSALVETLRYIDLNRDVVRGRAAALAKSVPDLFNWNQTAVDLLNSI